MDIDARRMVIVGIITTVIMFIGIPLFRAFRQSRDEKPRRAGGAEIFSYGLRTRYFLTALGAVCALCAVGPLAMIAWKYLGPDATLPSSRCCYHPRDDVWAGIFLLLGFGLGAYTCLVDPRKYFARLDDAGMTVRGLFSGVKSLRWNEVTGLKDYPALQMITVNGQKNGRTVRLWVPYTIASFADLIERLNEHAFFAEGQLQLAEAARAHLAEQGYVQAMPYKMFPPYLSFWRLAPDSQAIVGVLMGVKSTEPWEKPYYESFTKQGDWLDVMDGMQKKLEQNGFTFYPAMQQLFAEDFARIIATRRAA
ncbi:MAG: hypothetical protein PW788_01045 [Micavibrio sp.]|nr:hypothetical protein [Micavibrio sp.]